MLGRQAKQTSKQLLMQSGGQKTGKLASFMPVEAHRRRLDIYLVANLAHLARCVCFRVCLFHDRRRWFDAEHT